MIASRETPTNRQGEYAMYDFMSVLALAMAATCVALALTQPVTDRLPVRVRCRQRP
jgi:hypothetical protein